jgi:hypothetical protein
MALLPADVLNDLLPTEGELKALPPPDGELNDLCTAEGTLNVLPPDGEPNDLLTAEGEPNALLLPEGATDVRLFTEDALKSLRSEGGTDVLPLTEDALNVLSPPDEGSAVLRVTRGEPDVLSRFCEEFTTLPLPEVEAYRPAGATLRLLPETASAPLRA